jgi:predicted transglutaminase-like cysteine proteinase
MVAMALMFMATNAFADSASFFNSIEKHSDNVSIKWNNAIFRAKTTPPPLCLTLFSKRCAPEKRDEFIQGLIGKDRTTQLFEVNRYFNAVPYVSDKRNWGVADYWETPDEFVTRGGDCEDYAIAKYLALKQLGWADNIMRVAIVNQKNRETPHAILVVYNQGSYKVLDNMRDGVDDANNIDNYIPVYSINEAGVWLYTQRKVQISLDR